MPFFSLLKLEIVPYLSLAPFFLISWQYFFSELLGEFINYSCCYYL